MKSLFLAAATGFLCFDLAIADNFPGTTRKLYRDRALSDDASWGCGFDRADNLYIAVKSFDVPSSYLGHWVTLRSKDGIQFDEDDRFELAKGHHAHPFRLLTLPSGRVLVTGLAHNASDRVHGIIRIRGLDGKWKTARPFLGERGIGAAAISATFNADSIFVFGSSDVPIPGPLSSSLPHGKRLIILKGDLEGNEFVTLKEFNFGTGFNISGTCGLAAKDGSILAAGAASSTTDPVKRPWITIRSIDQGVSWNVVDQYGGVAGAAMPMNCFMDASGNLYVMGGDFAKGTDGKLHRHAGVIRVSRDHGATWAEEKYMAPEVPGDSLVVHNMTQDAVGRVFSAVIKYDSALGFSQALILMRGENEGLIGWDPVHNYRGSSHESGAVAEGLCADSKGRLVFTGYEYSFSTLPGAYALIREIFAPKSGQ